MRFDIDSYNEILESLTRNKRRSILTGFGVFWGLFMLLFLLGGGKGFKQLMEKNFAGFATNTTVMVSQPTSLPYHGFSEGRYWNLTANDMDRIRTLVPQVNHISPMCSIWNNTEAGASYNGNKYDSQINGVSPEYRFIETPRMKYGRYINDGDMFQARKVCVIGKEVYNALFPDGGNPCGEYIKVGSTYYEVVGVNFDSGSININGSTETTVVIPVSTFQRIFNYGNAVDLICFCGKPGVKMSELEPRIRQVMAREHNFDPVDESALMLLNTEQLFSIIDNLFRGINFLIWLIGIGTLLAGAIGVSNIMMVTVKERTTEIGIRRAIGATMSDILTQVIMESVLLTLVAGMGGIVFSVLVLRLLEIIAKGQFMIGFWTAIIAALLLTLLGVLAGLAPAYRAMAIKPVDAMRDE